MVDQLKKVNKNDRTRSLRSFKTIEPNAAGIDLGSREHWVASPPRDDDRPNVARFGTTTPELVRLARLAQGAGRQDRRHGKHGGVLDTAL